MRKTGLATLFAVAIAALQTPLPAQAYTAIAVDVGTGAVLDHKDAFQRWYPASITKLMTGYVAFRAVRAGKLSMTSPVRITKTAAAQPPSKMGYKPGAVLTLDSALKMMMVKSANDIAMAVGEAVGGSEMEFVAMMNDEAKRLGMDDTHFANPNGLPDKDQYTSARDLAVLVVAIRREFPEYAPLFSIEAITTGKSVIRNYNILIGRFAGADGMKTGFVCASGFNLAATATRDGRTVSAIVLGAESQEERAEVAADLLTKAFEADPAGRDTLSTLAPDAGPQRLTPPDIRGRICTKEAASDRYDGRDVDAHMVFRSPYIHPMARQPAAVKVGLGGAKGPAAANTPGAKVPIPTPRPDYQPQERRADASDQSSLMELRGPTPTPVPRPTNQ